ncbi:NAD(P)/FAD-dependent oxidoreductase [Christiangramia portivictoriae]|uniref:NAD(P)/FAD-dependent oxidoreductase n=1 Tax=Christiangramia portivictoriae TaxID=326069 RepID=UPI0004792BDC|nr:FAD-dependent oxidoreductase [Christiangramia portivictoriae]
MNKQCLIIGGGIIGLNIAYYLYKEGHEVTIIDRNDFSSGASFINAGYITPSHFIPLSSPGIITKGLKWMLNKNSPFYVKPRSDMDFIKWAWSFKRSATQKRVDQSIPAILKINLMSRDLYQAMKESSDFDFEFNKKGLLMCYKLAETGDEEGEVAEIALKRGLKVKHLNKEELKLLEPNVDFNVNGAYFYDSDAHMTPNDFMRDMKAFLKKQGVNFILNEEVEDFKINSGRINTVKTGLREIPADEVIIAAGTWTSKLAKKLKIPLSLEAGKGYSFNVEKSTGISIPTILIEARVAVTPMNGFTRFAGTMELSGLNERISKNRVETIANAAEGYYKGLKIDEEDISNAKSGLRPCSPDGLPYIGRSKAVKNLIFATGHAMMGWSLGPATGKLVSEIISEKKLSMDINPFSPDRKI